MTVSRKSVDPHLLSSIGSSRTSDGDQRCVQGTRGGDVEVDSHLGKALLKLKELPGVRRRVSPKHRPAQTRRRRLNSSYTVLHPHLPPPLAFLPLKLCSQFPQLR